MRKSFLGDKLPSVNATDTNKILIRSPTESDPYLLFWLSLAFFLLCSLYSCHDLFFKHTLGHTWGPLHLFFPMSPKCFLFFSDHYKAGDLHIPHSQVSEKMLPHKITLPESTIYNNPLYIFNPVLFSSWYLSFSKIILCICKFTCR